jgi:hypothetical protein
VDTAEPILKTGGSPLHKKYHYIKMNNFTNYRFKIEFAGSTYDNVYGIISIDDSDHIGKPNGLTGGLRITNGEGGTLNQTDLMIYNSQKVGSSFINDNFFGLDCAVTTPTTGYKTITSNNVQNSKNAEATPTDNHLNITIGQSSNINGILVDKAFLTPNNNVDNWFITTFLSDGNVAPFSLDIYSVVGTTDTANLTLISAQYTMTITAALNPACFIEGTKLLVHSHDKDMYVNIEDLCVGDLVKTYLHDDKRIKFIGRGIMTNAPNVWNGCVRRLAKSGDMIEDLFVTGAHSILVNELSTKETEGMMAIYGTANRKIDDKTLLLSWVSDKFEAVNDNKNYTYYHLVLEHENDENKRYGIWANGILTESQSEKHFLAKPYDLL